MQQGSLSSTKGRACLALGRVLLAKGKLDQARAAFQTAEENLRATLGANHAETLDAHRMANS